MDTTGVGAPDYLSEGSHVRGRHDGVTDDGGDPPPDVIPTVIVAEARLSGAVLALSPTLSALPDATFTPDHHTVSERGERSLVVSIAGAPADRIQSALADDPTVTDATPVQEFPDCLVYRAVLSEDAVLLAPTSLELGARTLSVAGVGGEWYAEVQFPDREGLIALRMFCEANDIAFGVDSLKEKDYLDTVTNALTDTQQETLRTAYHSGYFDVPRTFSQTDLAAELGVSTSAVSHRLRRATAQLIREGLLTPSGENTE